MFDITKLILKIPNALTDKECSQLISEFEQREKESGLEHCSHAQTGEDTFSTFKVIDLKPNTNSFNLVKNKTNKIINLYIKYLDSSNLFHTHFKHHLKYSHMYRLLKYETGAKIHPHIDYVPHIYGSISFNLNDDYEGGEFKFFNGKYSIQLKKGDVIIWPAGHFWVHEVTPITKGVRYSTNGFISQYPYEVWKLGNDHIENMYENYLSKYPKEELLGPYV